MASKRRPPLSPDMSDYLGLDAQGRHTLGWPSCSRPGVRHFTLGDDRRARSCTCEAYVYHPERPCLHMLAYPDALRRHLEPPPADPGGAALNRAQDALGDEIGDWRDEGPPYPYPLPTLDEAVALAGDRWMQSRTAAGVRLVCASCGAVRGWATEIGAIDWLATDGVCSCGGTGPTPPARGAARKPLDECLLDLYGA